MKMLALILVATALADGKGSGPYLPSGWRPEGPAFFLPSEIVKPLPSPTPIIDLNLQGSEASGSDFLQEYGPPKVQEISQNLLNQGLPGVTIEQTFGFAAQTAGSQVAAEKVVEISEVKPEVLSTELPTTVPQSSIDDSPPISAELPILDFEVKETTTIPNIEQAIVVSQTSQENLQESNVQSNSQESVNVQSNQQNSQASLQYVSELTNQQNSEVSNVQQSSQESVESNQQSAQSLEYQQESATASDLEKVTASSDSIGNAEVLLVNVPAVSEQKVPGVQNIPEIIASLEKETSTQQSEVNQAAGELTSDQSLGQIPEGFLEYGPPGFAEYGPPKEDQENLQAAQSNEASRRRRFSPRIRFGKKQI